MATSLETLAIQAKQAAQVAESLRKAVDTAYTSRTIERHVWAAEQARIDFACTALHRVTLTLELAASVAGDPESVAAEAVEPVPGVTEWVETDSHDDAEPIEKAIERWHVEHGIVSPSEDDFVNARWSIPTTALISPTLLDRLRVEMPCGNVYLLRIDHEGGGGDDGTGACVYYNVEEFEQKGRGDALALESVREVQR